MGSVLKYLSVAVTTFAFGALLALCGSMAIVHRLTHGATVWAAPKHWFFITLFTVTGGIALEVYLWCRNCKMEMEEDKCTEQE